MERCNGEVNTYKEGVDAEMVREVRSRESEGRRGRELKRN